jgi:hypothetical protein
VKVVVAAVAASKPTRSAELWSPVVDMKSRGAAGGDLHTSWHKGEHGSRKAIAAAVRPLLKPVEEEDGGGGVWSGSHLSNGGVGVQCCVEVLGRQRHGCGRDRRL